MKVKLEVFKREFNWDFRLVQYLTMGEADFNQFKRLLNELVIAAENFAREENFSWVLISTMSEDMDEPLKLARWVIDVVNRGNRQICVTLLQYSLDQPESFYAQLRLFARKKEVKKFQKNV